MTSSKKRDATLTTLETLSVATNRISESDWVCVGVGDGVGIGVWVWLYVCECCVVFVIVFWFLILSFSHRQHFLLHISHSAKH